MDPEGSGQDGTDLTKLWKSEEAWRDKQLFLQSRGYMLPYRYRVGWKPSWKGKKKAGLRYDYEDANTGTFGKDQVIMASTRMTDKLPVMLKHAETETSELPILSVLSSEPLASHPENRTVPLLDVILSPDSDEAVYLVFPQLRPFAHPPFQTPAEILHCFRRFLQGLQFLHEHNIAHLDIHKVNLMMHAGSMFPRGYNPIITEFYRASDPLSEQTRLKRAPRITRSLSDVKYYFIDFGHARQYSMNLQDSLPIAHGEQGHIIAPEMQRRSYNPMPVDVYALGTLFEEVIEGYEGWDDREVSKVVKVMKRKKPDQRSTAEEARYDFEELIKTIPRKELWKKIYPKSYLSGGFPPLTDLYYTLRAVYTGTNVLETELYQDIEMPSKDVASSSNKSLPSRLLSTLRYFV